MATTTIRIQVSSTDDVQVITETENAQPAAPTAPARDLAAEALAFLNDTSKYSKRSLAAVAKHLDVNAATAQSVLNTLIDRYQVGQSSASGLYYVL